MMLLPLDFKVLEKGWWNPKCLEAKSVQNLLDEYNRLKVIVQVNRLKPEYKHFFIGYMHYHRLFYLKETLIGESTVKEGSTLEEIEKLLSDDPSRNRLALKVQNLLDAIDQQFPLFGATNTKNTESFTTDLIKSIHLTVGAHDLIKAAGQYRETGAIPAGTNWRYLEPILISDMMEELCEFVRDRLEQSDSKNIITRVKIAALFMADFLQIHPFYNGNGRVARLAVSWLLKDVSVVPIPLYAYVQSRKTYLECLRERQSCGPSEFRPSGLARFILESVVRVHRQACYCLELSEVSTAT